MGKNDRAEYDKLAHFLFSEPDLESSAEDMQKLSLAVDLQIERARKAGGRQWIKKAEAGRKEFSISAAKIADQLRARFASKEALLDAIAKGLLGADVQNRFAVQFRNRKMDELSEEDLIKILSDQEILKLLEKNSRKEDT